MRIVWIVLAAAGVLAVAILALNGFLAYWDKDFIDGDFFPDAWTGPDSWAEWRDIAIVFSTFFWAIAGILTIVLVIVLIVVALLTRRILKENAAPALDSLRQSVDNIRGTTEFAGETVVSPIIRVYSVFKGVRSGLGAVTNVGDRVRGRKKKGKK